MRAAGSCWFSCMQGALAVWVAREARCASPLLAAPEGHLALHACAVAGQAGAAGAGGRERERRLPQVRAWTLQLCAIPARLALPQSPPCLPPAGIPRTHLQPGVGQYSHSPLALGNSAGKPPALLIEVGEYLRAASQGRSGSRCMRERDGAWWRLAGSLRLPVSQRRPLAPDAREPQWRLLPLLACLAGRRSPGTQWAPRRRT